MASNRDIAFHRRLLKQIAGIQLFAKGSPAIEGDSLVVIVPRGTCTNKATRIEFRSGRTNQVHVTFLKADKTGGMVVVTDHPEVFWDGLAQLLLDEAGLVVGEREGDERVGRIRTSRW